MTLPLSGPLSLSAIATELGTITPYSLRSMSSTAGFTTPDTVSEFYGYSAAPTTVTLYIDISVNNFSTYGYQGDNNSWQIVDNTTSTEVFYLEMWDEFEGTYSTSITLTIGHNYYFNGYMATSNSIFNEFVWEPTNGFAGSPIYTLNELCYYWLGDGSAFSQTSGDFTINSGGDMYMNGNVSIFDAGTTIDQCYYS